MQFLLMHVLISTGLKINQAISTVKYISHCLVSLCVWPELTFLNKISWRKNNVHIDKVNVVLKYFVQSHRLQNFDHSMVYNKELLIITAAML